MHRMETEMKDNPSVELMEQYARLQASYERQDGYAYRSRVRGVLKGLGFAENEYTLRSPIFPAVRNLVWR